MKKVLLVMSIVFVLTFAMATVAYATGASPAPSPTNSVSQVIIDSIEPVKTQAKEIFFNVIAWFIRAGLAIGIFVKGFGAVTAHRQGGAVSLWPIVLLVVGLIISFPLADLLWGLVG